MAFINFFSHEILSSSYWSLIFSEWNKTALKFNRAILWATTKKKRIFYQNCCCMMAILMWNFFTILKNILYVKFATVSVFRSGQCIQECGLNDDDDTHDEFSIVHEKRKIFLDIFIKEQMPFLILQFMQLMAHSCSPRTI